MHPQALPRGQSLGSGAAQEPLPLTLVGWAVRVGLQGQACLQPTMFGSLLGRGCRTAQNQGEAHRGR